VLINYKM